MNVEQLRARAADLTDEAYRPDAPWQLRDRALPLVLDLAAAVSLLVTREQELARERDAQEKVLAACARLLGADMPEWAPLPVREIGCEACAAADARVSLLVTERDELATQEEMRATERDFAEGRAEDAEARVEALVGRERELTRALEAIAANAEDWHGPEGLGSGHAKALEVIASWAREALAGGGRTPDEDAWHYTEEPVSPKNAVAEAGARLPECVERWPECESGAYHPNCCRFPKSCSCDLWPEPVSPGAADVAEAGEANGFTVGAGVDSEQRTYGYDAFPLLDALTPEAAPQPPNQEVNPSAQVREQPQEGT